MYATYELADNAYNSNLIIYIIYVNYLMTCKTLVIVKCLIDIYSTFSYCKKIVFKTF